MNNYNESHNTDNPEEEPQEAVNLRQAQDIAQQLNLGDGNAWGLDELAQILAVFDLDFTALNASPGLLAGFIRDRAANASTHPKGMEPDEVENACRRLTGALNGAAGMMAMFTAESTMRVDVIVDGFPVNAGAIMAMANVMAFSRRSQE